MLLDGAIAAIEACDSMDELRTALQRIIQDYGFSAFTFIDAGQPHLDVPYYTGTHEPGWERAYLQHGFVHATRRWCGSAGPTRRFTGAA